jgi:acetoin utilization deacetylase AcuC-like enzyme
MATLILRDDRFLEHDTGPGHPERAARLEAVHESLDRAPIPGTVEATPRAATRDELLAVHGAAHVDRVEATAGVAHSQLDGDTPASAGSWEAAIRAAGGACQAAELAVSGEADGAFLLCRPPGHHAEAAAAMGFCLFNNAAAAAEHAVRNLGCRRVVVVDPDVHHGNGTQHAFWDRADVLYVSSHRFPFYPGTGAADEVGAGDGTGFTVNLPLPAGLGDTDLVHLYESCASPVVRRFAPDLVIVSAGFDTWHADPLGDLAITETGFSSLFALFRRWAEESGPGRLVSLLEGGYALEGVVAGVRAGLSVMSAERAPEVTLDGAVSDAARAVEARVKRALSPHWPELRG